MQGEQADPAGGVDRILVRVVAVDGNFIGDVVEQDDPVEQDEPDKNQQAQREVIKHEPLLLKQITCAHECSRSIYT
ncbi:hypothetical protein D3C78_1616260 [compost metagenome]